MYHCTRHSCPFSLTRHPRQLRCLAELIGKVAERSHWPILSVIAMTPEPVHAARSDAPSLDALKLPLVRTGIADWMSVLEMSV